MGLPSLTRAQEGQVCICAVKEVGLKEVLLCIGRFASSELGPE